jgi:acetoin utilization deacetylase AcuC-like enzyme
MKRRLFYCDHHTITLPPGHRFPTEKYTRLRALLEAEGTYRFEPAPLADAATIELAHDPAYVRAILGGTAGESVMRRIGFPWSPGLVRRTLASVGGTLGASRDAMAHGFGGNLAGGTHHAFRGEGSGFCVFNDLAVAILALRREGLAARAAVIDLDVHQGDGTAAVFQNDPAVLTFSMHGENNFPFRKQRSRIDIALADGTGDAEYLARLHEALPQVFAFRPQVVFYQSGVDTLAGDRLGRLALTLDGLIHRDRLVLEASRGIPLVITLGGGYAQPIERTVEAHANTFRAALATFPGIETS